KKVYDLAYRTALSYRYRRGQLIVCDVLELASREPQYAREVLVRNRWGRRDLRTLLITHAQRPRLAQALASLPMHGRGLTKEQVDLRLLHAGGRIVTERRALAWSQEMMRDRPRLRRGPRKAALTRTPASKPSSSLPRSAN